MIKYAGMMSNRNNLSLIRWEGLVDVPDTLVEIRSCLSTECVICEYDIREIYSRNASNDLFPNLVWHAVDTDGHVFCHLVPVDEGYSLRLNICVIIDVEGTCPACWRIAIKVFVIFVDQWHGGAVRSPEGPWSNGL